MTGIIRLVGTGLALLGLAVQAQAQIAVAPPGGVAPGAGAAVPGAGGFGLTTAPVGSPFFGGMGSAAPGPYGLSTSPLYGGGYIPPWSLPYGDYYNSYRQDPYSGYLQGLASVTVATGQYHQDIQKARLTRYAANNAALDFAARRMAFEAWVERNRFGSTQMLRDRDLATDLERARKEAPATDIVSGKALNDLLRSINSPGRPKLDRGPNILLEDDVLRHINLAARASSGNVGLLRDGGKVAWPVALQDNKDFKKDVEFLGRKIEEAVSEVKGGGKVGPLLREINTALGRLERDVNDSTNDLPIDQYMVAKRFLRDLRTALRSLSEPNAKKYFDNTWVARGRNVAELIENMKRDGLTFNAATPGDEAAYTALYYSLRAFEASLAGGQR